ncbi:penicillin acylase family protein [Streptomyces griseochromogenes]|uniref:penicillin acylase family protein n=1 Tax=Streptomyces griseochromogenes TaxID=68214 RepID=UPI00379BBB27
MTTETYRDAWGIPHLRASSARELARAQGRVTALDRAWQLEVERHRFQGTSASFLGAAALPWDVFARRARLEDTARRCFAALEGRDPETADWVRSYVDGVNEGLPQGAARAPEFTRTGLVHTSWQPWTPLGIWLGTHILFAGFPAKLWREEAIRHLGPEAVALFATDGPGTAGSNGWLLSGARTDTGHALIAGDPHRFIEDPGVYQQIHLACPEFDVIGLAVPGVPGIAHFGHTGTVAWSITNAMADYQDLYRERLRRTGAGVEALGPDGLWHRALRHTETVEVAGEPPTEIELIETERGPVIAGGPEGLERGVVRGEPERPAATATDRQPEWFGAGVAGGGSEGFGAGVAGGGSEGSRPGVAEPGFEGPWAGGDGGGPEGVGARAGERAFDGLEAGIADRRRSEGPEAGVAGVSAEAGVLAAAGSARDPRAADDEDAPQVPPARDDESRSGGADGNGCAEGEAEAVALALRYPPRVTEDLGFSALLPLLRARRVEDVDAAFDSWAEPVNVVQAADTEGGLLHRVAGKVPRRAEPNRLRLVPAWRPGHAWDGWHDTPYAGLSDGIAVMANQRGPATPLGVEFAPPHRAERIRTLLQERRTWSAADLPSIHTDTFLASAAPLLDHLAALDDLTPEAARLRDRLLSWNRHMDADSTEAAAFAAVRTAVVRRLAAHPAFAALTEPPAYPEVLLPWLALAPRVGHALEHLLRAPELYGIDRAAAVRAAVEETAAAPPSGTWADTHRLAPWKALPGEPYDEPGLAGDHDCVLCTSAVPGLTDLAARGPAARYVWDLARRENSRWVVPFGADGVPGTPHHRDQLPLWLKGELAPVVTDWTLLTLEHTEETDD